MTVGVYIRSIGNPPLFTSRHCHILYDIFMETAHWRRPTPAGRRRIIIVDDNPFFAYCLRVWLENEADLGVAAVITTLADAAARIPQTEADLLVIDVKLGLHSGLELGRRLRRELRVATPILFVSTVAEPAAGELAGIPNSRFARKTTRPREFLDVLRGILGAAPSERAGADGSGLTQYEWAER